MSNHAFNLPVSRKDQSARLLLRRSRLSLRAARLRAGATPLVWAALSALPLASLPAQAATGKHFSPVLKLAAGIVERQVPSQPLQIKVERGGRTALPLANVTRVITDDVDVARAAFEGNQAFVEGVSSGSSVLEVQTADGRVQKITVQVVAPGSLGKLPATPSRPATPIGGTAELSSKPIPAPTTSIPVPVAAIGSATPAIMPAQPNLKAPSPHSVSVRVSPADDNAAQALVTVTYANSGSKPQDVTVHAPLDEVVSYVTNSATGSPRYDNAGRELSWSLNGVESGGSRSVSFRVEPLDKGNRVFQSIATIESADGGYASSKSVPYSFVTTPLLTVFALPDRIMAGRVGPVLVDVRGAEAQATIDRLQTMGVVTGRDTGLFYPASPTQRAEYAVMTLKGLNLRDLRDMTAIKFVLTRRSLVNLSIKNEAGQTVAQLIRNVTLEAGEKTQLWNGRSGSGFVAPGRYSYVCTARDNAKGDTTTLSGVINVVAQTPLKPLNGQNPFHDVKNSDWYAGYLALAEKQNLVHGYPDKTFHPTQSISRVEATVIAMRALGLEDLARSLATKDVGFLDYQDIPVWAVGHVNAAVMTQVGGHIIKGYPSNFFLPMKALNRAEAAMIVQRLIDKDANKRITVSGAMVPGAVVTINNRTVEAADDGAFQFVIDQDNTNPITVAVTDTKPAN